MEKQPVGQLPDLKQSNNDDEIMVITDSEHNQLKKEKISDLITDFTSTNENNALTKGTDGKMFVTDFGNASNITEGTLPTSVLPEIPLEKIPDIPKDKLPPIETSDLPVSGVTADTYAYPSSVTVNSQGQVTAIEEGTPSGANADTDLSNLTYQGTQRFLSNQQLSNYIKYSPKRVTCKLDADGTFRALAGSTFIIPNGFNEDGSRRFDYVTSTKDSVRVQEAPTGPKVRFLFFQTLSAINSGAIGWKYSCVSGAFVTSDTQPQTTPGVYKFWYDTTNNRIRVYSGLTNTWNTENLSLPFAMTYCDLPSGTTVDYSFTEMNGVHWFGNTVFLDKDVTMLCSNYKDPETGVLKSIEYTTDNVYYASRTLSDNYTYYPVDFYFNISSKTFGTYASIGSGSSFYGAMSPKAYSTTGAVWYNLNNNRYRVSNSGEQTIYDADFVYIGTFLMDLEKGCLFPITAAGTTTPLATYNDVYRLPSYYGWYSMTYHNTTGTAGYRLYFYDAGFRYMAFGIQWGYLTGSSGTVNLYHPFSFPNYHISLTYKASANQGGKCRTATVLSSTASSFQVGYLDSGSVTVQQGVGWVAIGC